jgi:hemolysin activation/secretion protein
MKTARTLMPLPVLLAGVMAFSSAWAAPAADESPGVQLRELEQVDPDRYRAPRPLDFEVPEAPPMQAVPDAELTVNRFQVVGNTAFDDDTLLALISEYRGTMTFSRLLEATAVLSDYYRSNGYMVARAYVPEQEVSDGIIDIVMLEGVLGEVQFTGDTPIARERSARRMDRLARNGLINEYDLEYGALLLNDLPGTRASVALQPGAETGLSDVILDMEDEGTFEFALDYNNYGSEVTGENRFGAQIGINNLFNAGDRITLRPIVSDSGDTVYGSAGFDMPLFTPATRAGIRFSRLTSELGEEFEQLEVENTATAISLDISHAFIRSRNKNLFATLTYSDRAFERECGFCKTQLIPVIEDADYELDVVELGASGDWRDELWSGGINTWYAAVRKGLSDVDKIDAGITTPGADRIDGKFTSLRLGGQRLQRITDLTTLSIKLDGQSSSNDLDAAERISLGGPGSVRAYRPSEALGDKGIVMQTELRRQFPGIADWAGWLSSVEGYLLVDAGASELNDNGNNISRRLTNQRSGWGGGLRVSGGNEFYIDLVGASRLSDRESLVDQPDDSKTNFWAQAVYWF